MTLQPELTLTLVATAIYLADCIYLLASSECLIEQRGPNERRALFGGQLWRLARKEPLLINPLTPWRRLQRIQWTLRALETGGSLEVPVLVEKRWVAALATSLMILVLAGLPIVLLVVPVVSLKLTVITMIYLVIIVILRQLFRHSEELGFEPGVFVQTAAEILLCPPLAINAYRKIKARKEPLRLVALGSSDLDLLADGVLPRLQERLKMHEEASEAHERLRILIETLNQKP